MKPTRRPVPYFLYCATDGEHVKVGSTHNVAGRMSMLKAETGRRIALIRTWPLGVLPSRLAWHVEQDAHSTIGPQHRAPGRGREWYDHPIDEVIASVSAAIGRFEVRVW